MRRIIVIPAILGFLAAMGAVSYLLDQRQQHAEDRAIIGKLKQSVAEAVARESGHQKVEDELLRPLSSDAVVEMENLRIENQRWQVRYDALNRKYWTLWADVALLEPYERCENDKCLAVVEVTR